MIRRVIGTAVTAVIVVAALTLAVWFVFAWLTGATLITFRTGSMAPSMPQGTLAVSLPAQASELKPGDVVTVHRAFDGQPVTHRVVEVREAANAQSNAPLQPAQRELVLQGDDNAMPDGELYVVSEVRIVTLAFPGFGAGLQLMQSPLGLGVLLLGAGGLTVWAFWPKRDSSEAEIDEVVPAGGPPTAPESTGSALPASETVRT